MSKLAQAMFLSQTSQTAFNKASKSIKQGEIEKARNYDALSSIYWSEAVECFWDAVKAGEFKNQPSKVK
jgi:hypothetical protein